MILCVSSRVRESCECNVNMSSESRWGERSWWGWGDERTHLSPSAAWRYSPKSVSELSVPPSRLSMENFPHSLQQRVCFDKRERILHSRGRAYGDIVENLRGAIGPVVDCVVFPESEAEILELFTLCGASRIAVTTFGGGSSVVHALTPTACPSYTGTVSVDMQRFSRVVSVDTMSRLVVVQGGVYGPHLEAELKKYDLTLRHYPQSFEFSTVGGWVATRAGGHFATGLTHIDNMVARLRIVTPSGIVDTLNVPGSGAGPDPKSLYIGSEGTLGIITEVTLRVRPRPKFRATVVCRFPCSVTECTSAASFTVGAQCVREIVQSGLQPANLRLIHGEEFDSTISWPQLIQNGTEGLNLSGADKSVPAALVMGFESPTHPVTAEFEHALTICRKHGAQIGKPRLTSPDQTISKRGADQDWGKAFTFAPYVRDALICMGLLVETFETCITWGRFLDFHAAVLASAYTKLQEVYGGGHITWRITHVYPDGPALYYTVVAHATAGREAQQWQLVKDALVQTIAENGGTSTHHHAVGRSHLRGYQYETGAQWQRFFVAIKRAHDPQHILNPGVLVDHTQIHPQAASKL